MSNLISINADSMKRYGRLLRKADPEVKAQLTAGLRIAAEQAAQAAKGIAEGFSTRIPKTIRPGGTAGRAWVRAGGPKAPHAPALEHRGQGGTFRHPVFGNKEVWVDQDAHPYLTPAVDRTVDADKIASLIVRRIEEM